MTRDMQAIVQRLEEVEKQVAHLAALATFDDLSRAQQETMLQRDRGCLRGAWSWRRPQIGKILERKRRCSMSDVFVVEKRLKDFPPNRHVNGHVIYPDGYEPTPMQRLGGIR